MPKRNATFNGLNRQVLIVGFALTAALPGAADQALISIDGLFADWSGITVAYSDSSGDGGAVDFGRLWLADDDRFLFLRIELGAETDPSENNNLRLYLDTDANSATGLSIAGIGAELEWRLGTRDGTVRLQGQTTSVRHDDLRFREAPTVTADVFEMAIGRDTLPDGVHPLFSGSQVRVVMVDVGGDQLPNAGDFVTYTLDQGQLPPETNIPLERERAGDLRIATYNVLNDSPWSGGQEPRFGRQFAATAPDILNFQEVRNHSAADAAALVATWLPPGPGESWHSAGNSDCKTVSRFPILGTWPLDGNLALLIDTSSVLRRELLLINAHLPCCANDSGRQNEIDRIMAFIRDAKEPGGVLELAPNTPIVITGDLNLVGFRQQLTSLLTGDIVNEGTFGADFTPDWDGTDLANLISRQTEKRMAYTWRNDNSSFWPGHLDYQIYSDRVLEVRNHFILYTPEMSAENLNAYGLVVTDSQVSDHLLFCADFRIPFTTRPTEGKRTAEEIGRVFP